MQNNSLDVELQRTLNELCMDLFATSALDDCNAILRSLAQLAETFPQAQALLGRLLSGHEDIPVRSRFGTVSKLSLLSTNFLYKKETARNAVALLAALANDNPRNQRRIVQRVTGVILDVDSSKGGSHRSSARADVSHLYALTVPATVTTTYRKWRKRQRQLQNCRLPSGVPPAHDGVPMPCYCDGCLGTEQFLSSWQQHFHDLSRWSLDSAKEASTGHLPPSISTNEFLRIFLEDSQLRVCAVREALDNKKEAEDSCVGRANRQQSVVYYFVSPEGPTAATTWTQVPFNPLFHVSAIAIADEVDIAATKKARLEQLKWTITSSSLERAESSTLASDQVILLTSTRNIKSCTSPVFPKSSEAVVPSCPYQAENSNERLLGDFLRFEEQHNQLAQCDSFVTDVSSEDCEAEGTTRQLLLYMIAFFESVDQIPLPADQFSCCGFTDSQQSPNGALTTRQVKGIDRAPIDVKITITAKLQQQVLQIDCSTENRLLGSFSNHIPQRELIGEKSTSLSLLCLSDEALESLLQRCRICTCEPQESHEDATSIFYLRPSTPWEEEFVHTSEELQNDEEDNRNIVAGSSDLQQHGAICLQLPGLSSEAKRVLVKLEAVVSEEKSSRLTCKGLISITRKLAKVVVSCNERIAFLSLARDRKLARPATKVNRMAAISRCCHCRDLLIQLGKKLALKIKTLEASTPILQGKLSRVAKLVRTSIHEVLAHSDTFQTPDPRVENLQLDHRI